MILVVFGFFSLSSLSMQKNNDIADFAPVQEIITSIKNNNLGIAKKQLSFLSTSGKDLSIIQECAIVDALISHNTDNSIVSPEKITGNCEFFFYDSVNGRVIDNEPLTEGTIIEEFQYICCVNSSGIMTDFNVYDGHKNTYVQDNFTRYHNRPKFSSKTFVYQVSGIDKAGSRIYLNPISVTQGFYVLNDNGEVDFSRKISEGDVLAPNTNICLLDPSGNLVPFKVVSFQRNVLENNCSSFSTGDNSYKVYVVSYHFNDGGDYQHCIYIL